MSEVIVFYAGQVHWEFANEGKYERLRRESLIDHEIYNGAIVWYRHDRRTSHWYRMDGTPMLLEDVPKDLRVWVMVLS